MKKPLSKVNIGESGHIVELPKDNQTLIHLTSLGLLTGDKIEVTGRALFGGPISLKHSDKTFLALRKSHAKSIMVEMEG